MIRNSMPRGLVCLLLALAPAWAQSGGKITSRQVEGLQAQVEAQPTNRASSERRLEALRKLASACSSRRVKRRLSEDSKEWISDVDDVLEGMDEDAAGMEISWAWVDCALSGICHLLLQVEDEDVEEVESTGYVSAKLQDRVVSALRGRTSDEETFWPLAELLGQMLVAEWERDIDLPRDELHEQLWEIARDGVFPGEGAPTAEDEAACRALDRHIARVLGYLVSTPVPPEIDSGHWQGVLEKLPGQLPGGLDALRADSAAAIALVGEVADYVDDVEGNETWKARILSLVRLGELARDARSRDAEAEVAFAVALDGILRLLIEYARVGAEGAPPPLRFPPGMRRAHALAVAGGAGREPAGIELRVALGSVLALARGDAADEDFPPAELLEPLALVPRDEIAAGLGRLALWSMPPEVVQEQLEGLGAGDTTLAQAPARGAHLAMVIRYILARSRVSIRRTELSLNVADELGALDNRERQRDAAVVIDLFREPASQLARSAQAPGGLVRPPVSDHPLETAILSRLLERMQAPCASVLLRRVLLGAFVARAAWPEGQRASDLLARAGDLLARPAVEPGALELLGRGLARSWEEAHQPPPTEEEPPAVPTPTAPPDEATAVPVPPADPPPEAAATPADADTETAALTDDGPADKGAEAGEGSVPPARTGRERPARRQRGAVLPWLLLLVVVAAFVGQHVLRRRRAAAAPTAPPPPSAYRPSPLASPDASPSQSDRHSRSPRSPCSRSSPGRSSRSPSASPGRHCSARVAWGWSTAPATRPWIATS